MKDETIERRTRKRAHNAQAVIRKIFAANLRRLMVAKGFEKQWALAEAAGVNIASISSYLNERYMPQAENMARIAEVLEVSVEELLKGV